MTDYADYVYEAPPEERIIGPLPEADYDFVVTKCSQPYETKSGNVAVAVEFDILPSHHRAFYHPWKGVDRNGEKRDGIAEFLHAINRIPKVGERPRWDQLIGARGRCRLIQEEAQQGKLAGQMVNKVHYLYSPRLAQGPATTPPAYDKSEFERAREQARANAGNDKDDAIAIPF